MSCLACKNDYAQVLDLQGGGVLSISISISEKMTSLVHRQQSISRCETDLLQSVNCLHEEHSEINGIQVNSASHVHHLTGQRSLTKSHQEFQRLST